MDFLHVFLDWASDAKNSNIVRTIAALLALPAAIWGFYLFVRGLFRNNAMHKNKAGAEKKKCPDPLVIIVTGMSNKIYFEVSKEATDSGQITISSMAGTQRFIVHPDQDVSISVKGNANEISYPNHYRRRLKYEDSGMANRLRWQ
jgi:hypothetical protein